MIFSKKKVNLWVFWKFLPLSCPVSTFLESWPVPQDSTEPSWPKKVNYVKIVGISIQYPAKSGHFSAIWYPAGYRILKNRIFCFRISGRISGKPDINKTFLILFEDLRCFNYLSNSVEQQTGIEISGILFWEWPDIKISMRHFSD